jgi:hypothetical protein
MISIIVKNTLFWHFDANPRKNNAFCQYEALLMIQNKDQHFGHRANCLTARVKTGNAGA